MGEYPGEKLRSVDKERGSSEILCDDLIVEREKS